MTESQFEQLLASQLRMENTLQGIRTEIHALATRVTVLETKEQLTSVSASSPAQKAAMVAGPIGGGLGLTALLDRFFDLFGK